jgi:hypothetical protein
VNSLPKPVLAPVMRTTCLEFMIIPPNPSDAGTKQLDTKIAIIAEFVVV